eukprot:TRINITY_DN33173_c0_g1_i1.p1 TRINITY_DN33173_c0_g1~~TRINITY_DN33173_c0_g1_i1.p1  ORF type:complete len:161 (-),score=47.23 TRINITY_DN33173_c0_g1_i1:11-469(-)
MGKQWYQRRVNTCSSQGQALHNTSPTPCYFPPPKLSLVDQSLCDQIHQAAKESPPVFSLEVAPGTGQGWRMKAGQICKISLVSGSQVGDINIWSAANPKERMFTGKTRQIQASHLSVYDRIWSNLPHLRPLVTITGDSLRYVLMMMALESTM